MKHAKLQATDEQISAFCRRWRIAELALFGSVLREDFGPNSDVDVLVLLEPDVVWDFDDWETMRNELAGFFGRPVDLVSRRTLRNPFLRHEILSTRSVLYAA